MVQVIQSGVRVCLSGLLHLKEMTADLDVWQGGHDICRRSNSIVTVIGQNSRSREEKNRWRENRVTVAIHARQDEARSAKKQTWIKTVNK